MKEKDSNEHNDVNKIFLILLFLSFEKNLSI
jgi:hypothetical protein